MNAGCPNGKCYHLICKIRSKFCTGVQFHKTRTHYWEGSRYHPIMHLCVSSTKWPCCMPMHPCSLRELHAQMSGDHKSSLQITVHFGLYCIRWSCCVQWPLHVGRALIQWLIVIYGLWVFGSRVWVLMLHAVGNKEQSVLQESSPTNYKTLNRNYGGLSLIENYDTMQWISQGTNVVIVPHTNSLLPLQLLQWFYSLH